MSPPAWRTCSASYLPPATCHLLPLMKTHTHYLWFETNKRQEIIDITDDVERELAKSGVREGMALVSAMHISASVFVNDHESGLWHDILHWLEHTVAPWEPARYRHNETGEDNAAAHLRSLTVGHEVIVPVTAGKLDLGPWQRVFYGEWDGQRRKRVIIKILGEEAGVSVRHVGRRAAGVTSTRPPPGPPARFVPQQVGPLPGGHGRCRPGGSHDVAIRCTPPARLGDELRIPDGAGRPGPPRPGTRHLAGAEPRRLQLRAQPQLLLRPRWPADDGVGAGGRGGGRELPRCRSEEHTSELQSRFG